MMKQSNAQASNSNCNIKVAIRVRPLIESELNKGHRTTRLKLNDKDNVIRLFSPPVNGYFNSSNNKHEEKQYQFDKVFGQASYQKQIFDQLQVNYLVKKVIEGYNSTIFVYGQTGSGKTYTMEGYEYANLDEFSSSSRSTNHLTPIIADNENVGVAIRTIREFYKQRGKLKDHLRDRFRFYVSFFQIYNEKIYDLLNFDKARGSGAGKRYIQNQADLKVRQNQKQEFQVENLYLFECNDDKEAVTLFNQGIKNKIVSSHSMNHASSRSHCIFSIQVDQVSYETTDDDYSDGQPKVLTSSKMFLVDLAGSERMSIQDINDKQSQKETIGINKSLMILRKCMGALETNSNDNNSTQKHVPYRECKLTSILRQSLGGNAYCLMIACISPSDENFDENMQTLNYAMKTNNIKNKPIKNVDQNMLLIERLKQRNKSLTKDLQKQKRRNNFGQNNLNSTFISSDYNDYKTQSVNSIRKLYKNIKKEHNYDSIISNQRESKLNQSRSYINETDSNKMIEEISKAIQNGQKMSSTTINLLQELLKKNKEIQVVRDSLSRINMSLDDKMILRSQIDQLKKENQDLKLKLVISYNKGSQEKIGSTIESDAVETQASSIFDRKVNSRLTMNNLNKALNNTLTLPELNRSYINEIDESEVLKSTTTPSEMLKRSFIKDELDIFQKKMNFLQIPMDREKSRNNLKQNLTPDHTQIKLKNSNQYQELQNQIKQNAEEIQDLKRFLK
ncbi:kinesin motor domain containing protein [Stylonychia lemnae]|uniref:Kinesin-like protein n=1 Tax=Stylonychia lemnae TaxID=5949 RepID=A0A078B254_STYLE|nr:kinesin motor domain containing protein [Stylonychia lemnae]|eukprot:CDW88341.1 kinesin motor domain containing protein [Stylonychia lemnae]